MKKFLATAVLSLALAAPAFPCTTFCLRDEGRILFGKNYDWNVGDGLLVVNKRGVARKADVKGSAADWVSRFGSVTFNQYGRDFPSGGMNEAGLVIELMWLEGSRFPEADARPAVDVLQWIQYNLDNHTTVAEVLASDRKVRVAGPVPLHYLVADAKGQVATVEFLDGKLVAHAGDKLPVPALTNSTYAESLSYQRELAAEKKAVPGGPGSLVRFARAAERVRGFDAKGGDSVRYAFDTLAGVAQPGYTQWSIVYEIDRGRIHFRTKDQPKIRTVSLKELDFRCASPVRVLDLQADLAGDVTAKLVPYSREINHKAVSAAFHKTPFLASVPEQEIGRVARYPEGATCQRSGAQ